MPVPTRQWTAPKQEDPAPKLRTRRTPIWVEPDREEEPPPFTRPFRILQAKPKVKITHTLQPTLHGPYFEDRTCNFPRFKKLRIHHPEKSSEKVLRLQKKNSETWVSILSYLHRYSNLSKKRWIANIRMSIFPT